MSSQNNTNFNSLFTSAFPPLDFFISGNINSDSIEELSALQAVDETDDPIIIDDLNKFANELGGAFIMRHNTSHSVIDLSRSQINVHFHENQYFNPSTKIKNKKVGKTYKETINLLRDRNNVISNSNMPLLSSNGGPLCYKIYSSVDKGKSITVNGSSKRVEHIEISTEIDTNQSISFTSEKIIDYNKIGLNKIINLHNFYSNKMDYKNGKSISIVSSGILKYKNNGNVSTKHATICITFYREENDGFLGIYEIDKTMDAAKDYIVLSYLDKNRIEELKILYGNIDFNDDDTVFI